ncbi:hypothetical protein OF83DRAFT_1152166 [Amylostereum chailletii]|nr:hypothetical protein OF83DRAFT_1152166 [Amylostereum chailletii]
MLIALAHSGFQLWLTSTTTTAIMNFDRPPPYTNFAPSFGVSAPNVVNPNLRPNPRNPGPPPRIPPRPTQVLQQSRSSTGNDGYGMRESEEAKKKGDAVVVVREGEAERERTLRQAWEEVE